MRWVPLLLALSGCLRSSQLDAGSWSFDKDTLRFRTRINRTSVDELTIRNNFDGAIEIEISRPISSGSCPDEPFDVPSLVRIGANGSQTIRVEHTPTAWTESEQCLFQIQLSLEDVEVFDSADPDNPRLITDRRSVLLVGGIIDVDADGDGAFVGRDGDCNDHANDPLAPDISPFERELCNGYDDDCDGLIDDADINEQDALSRGDKQEHDANGDLVIVPLSSVDGPPWVGRQGTWLPDNDGDGWPANVQPIYTCASPPGFTQRPCGDPADARYRECEPCVAIDDPPGCVDLESFPDASDNGAGFDCNDQALEVSPGSFDVVGDGVDRDCDSLVTCFADSDNDGWGDAFTLQTIDPSSNDPFCRGRDVSAIDLDCDDTRADVNPGQVERCDPTTDEDCDLLYDDADPIIAPGNGYRPFYPDDDGDGFGTSVGRREACEQPLNYVENNQDCDDSADTVNPDAEEVCNNRDDDCDGFTDADAIDQREFYVDRDGDGFGDEDYATEVNGTTLACFQAPVGYAVDPNDCDDANADVRPFRTEVVANDIDDNCDGWSLCYEDGDGDGFGFELGTETIDIDATNPACTPNVELDCRRPSDGVELRCQVSRNLRDCDDTDEDVRPGAAEVCDNVDNDCDGRVDAADPDLQATSTSVYFRDRDGDGRGDPNDQVVGCSQPANYVTNSEDCDDSSGLVYPGAPEIPGNGIDENCDNQEMCWVDIDGDGESDTTAPAMLAPPFDIGCQSDGFTLTERRTDCDDTDPTINLGGVEACDGVDNDCDNRIDDADRDPVGVLPWYPDRDGDGWGTDNDVLACVQPPGFTDRSGDCNDASALANPAQTEICDGIDNDCNQIVDDEGQQPWFLDNDGDGFGDQNTLLVDCEAPGTDWVEDAGDCDDVDPLINPGGMEVCDPVGRDEDCDGAANDADGDFTPTLATGGTRYRQDLDGDGVSAGADRILCAPGRYDIPATIDEDCDDVDPTRSPRIVEEPANGIDEDCNGLEICFCDQDGDRLGTTEPVEGDLDCTPVATTPAVPAGSCSAATVTGLTGDCDDLDATIGVSRTWFIDADGDSWGNPNSIANSCQRPGTVWVERPGDCDDSRADRAPDLPERCDPLDVDEDCNFLADNDDLTAGTLGTTPFLVDQDRDGSGVAGVTEQACDLRPGLVAITETGDCDDLDRTRHPAAIEGPVDGIDQDCDGQELCFCNRDLDAAGTDVLVGSTDLTCTPASGLPVAGSCQDSPDYVSAVDGDCDDGNDGVSGDEIPWFFDSDGDGYGVDVVSVISCLPPIGSWAPRGGDCNDNEGTISPVAPETCDAIDNNCNGAVDEGASPVTWYPDCDGDTYGDENATAGRLVVSCVTPTSNPTCGSGAWPNRDWSTIPTDCADRAVNRNPGAAEQCDPIDFDCDGDPYNGLTVPNVWPDGDGDGQGDATASGTPSCTPGPGEATNGDDCDDSNPRVSTGVDEASLGLPGCDGLVNDCARRGAAGVFPDDVANCGPGVVWDEFDGTPYLFSTTALPLEIGTTWAPNPAPPGGPGPDELDATEFCAARGYHVVHYAGSLERAEITTRMDGLVAPGTVFWVGGRVDETDCGTGWAWYDPLQPTALQCTVIDTALFTLPGAFDTLGLADDSASGLQSEDPLTPYPFVCELP